MEIEKSSLFRKGIPILLLALFIFLLYVYFFVGFAEIADAFMKLNPLYYSLAFIVFLLSTTFYSLTWWRLLRILSVTTTFRKPFLFTWVAAFVDILIPAEAVSGEVSRAYLMYRDSNENAGKIVTSVVSHRILTMATTLGGMIVASVVFILRYEYSGFLVGILLIVAVCLVLSLGLLIYLSLKRQATTKLVDWVVNLLKRVFKGRFQDRWISSKARRMLNEFHKGIDILGERPRQLVLPMALSVLAWLFDILIAFFAFSSLDISISFSAIIIVHSITMAVQTIPVGIPGEVGIIEGVMILLYTPLGVTLADATAATILIRALTLWAKLILSGVAVQWVGIKMLKGSLH